MRLAGNQSKILVASRILAETSSSFERGAIPLRQIGCRLVCGLEEFQDPVVGRRGFAHTIVWQDEFSEIGAVERRRWSNGRVCKTVWLRIRVRVEGGVVHRRGARPESAAADFMGIRLSRDF